MLFRDEKDDSEETYGIDEVGLRSGDLTGRRNMGAVSIICVWTVCSVVIGIGGGVSSPESVSDCWGLFASNKLLNTDSLFGNTYFTFHIIPWRLK